MQAHIVAVADTAKDIIITEAVAAAVEVVVAVAIKFKFTAQI